MNDDEQETGFEILKACCSEEKLQKIEEFYRDRQHIAQDCLNCPFCSIPESAYQEGHLNSDGEFYIDCELLERSIWAEYPSVQCFLLWREFMDTI